MNDKVVYVLAGLVSILAIFAIYQTYQLNSIKSEQITGAAVGPSINDVPTGNIFNGKITNVKVSPGKIIGTGVYDRSCKAVENGLTNCDGGIKTKEYGTLNFNYKHDMHAEPCISPGDYLLVEILDAEGNAKVQRY